MVISLNHLTLSHSLTGDGVPLIISHVWGKHIKLKKINCKERIIKN